MGKISFEEQTFSELKLCLIKYLISKFAAVAHLLLAGAGNEVQQRDALVAAGLGVRDPRQAVQLEAHGFAALAAVHVVPEREDKLQHSPQTLASLNFFASLQNSQNFWFNFIVPDIELLLVVKRAQPLLVVSDPDTSSSQPEPAPSHIILLGQLEEEPVCARQVVDLVRVLVQQRALLGARRELEHLLHHVHGELVPRVHREDCPAPQQHLSGDCNMFMYTNSYNFQLSFLGFGSKCDSCPLM